MYQQAYLIVDEVVNLLQGTPVQPAGERLELARKHRPVLHTDFPARLEPILLHELHRLVFHPFQRFSREGLHLGLEALPTASRDGTPPGPGPRRCSGRSRAGSG